MTDMKQVMDSIENAMRLQIQANSERRAAKAEQDEKEFKEKLMQAAASEVELEGMSAKAKGSAEAVRRDQLMMLMMVGL